MKSTIEHTENKTVNDSSSAASSAASSSSAVSSVKCSEVSSLKCSEHRVDLLDYPTSFVEPQKSVTIGDLHGNFIKLLYFLIKCGVVEIEGNAAEIYNKFNSVYKETFDVVEECRLALRTIARHRRKEDTEELIKARETYENSKPKLSALKNEFDILLKKLKIKNPEVLVRLIGDEFADRGASDYYTLELLSWLHDNNINVNINVSNHSVPFIYGLEKLRQNKSIENELSEDLQREDSKSLLGLSMLLEGGIIKPDEILNKAKKCYTPSLRVIDYEIQENNFITLYTHAPVPFGIIEFVAQKLAVDYKDNSIDELAQTIDNINLAFQKKLETNKAEFTISNCAQSKWCSKENKDFIDGAVTFVAWNRWEDELITNEIELRSGENKGYGYEMVQGHDPHQPQNPRVYNLDTIVGKQFPYDKEFLESEKFQTLHKDEQIQLANEIDLLKILSSNPLRFSLKPVIEEVSQKEPVTPVAASSSSSSHRFFNQYAEPEVESMGFRSCSIL